MPNYNMQDFAGFKKKVKSGGYDDATAARRGLGKVKSFTEKDREAGRRFIDKYFGTAETAAPKTTRKKRPAKKTAKKAASKRTTSKKTTKRRAKKAAAAKPVEAKKATSKRAPKKAGKKASKKRSGGKGTQSRHGADSLPVYVSAIGAHTETAETLIACRTGTDGLVDVKEGLETVAKGLTSLVRAMQHEVVQPLTVDITPEEARGSDLFARASAAVRSDPAHTPPTPPAVQTQEQPVNGAGEAQHAQAPAVQQESGVVAPTV